MKTRFFLASILFFLSGASIIQAEDDRGGPMPATAPVHGVHFSKKTYSPEPLPTFADSRDKIPSPILDGEPGLVDMYWKCWEIAFKNLYQPPKGSPFVSNWIDASFSDYIYQWDTIFMVMFARYGHSFFPAIQSLDNFYAMQRPNGYINRELRHKDGAERYYGGTANSVNPPLFSWAEIESFKLTGDKSRFAMVLPVLEKYVEWLNTDGDPESANGPDWLSKGRRAAKSVHHLYWNTPLGSGMDNTPRHGNGWVDMSSQMVIQYNNLATIAYELKLPKKAAAFRKEAKEISARINKWCWNEADGFYYDVDNDGTQFKVKTLGGFWPLLSGTASKAQAEKLVKHLENEKEFWRPFVFPSLAANEKDYKNTGEYWQGGVWAPTNMMVIKGLERYGYEELATTATEKYLAAMYEVYKPTGTVWENYAPELPYRPGSPAQPDFVGWTGDGPIALLIENILGFRSDGVRHSLTWNLTRTDRHGIRNLNVGGTLVSAICEARKSSGSKAVIRITTGSPITFILKNGSKKKIFKLKAGTQTLHL